MKLIITIVQDKDASELINAITKVGFGITKLASTGGFLKLGNTTLMIGVDDKKVDQVLAVIDHKCKTRKKIEAEPSPVVASMGLYVPYPVEVEAGGAIVFVVDVDKYVKI